MFPKISVGLGLAGASYNNTTFTKANFFSHSLLLKECLRTNLLLFKTCHNFIFCSERVWARNICCHSFWKLELFPVIFLVETECQELHLSSGQSISCSPKMAWDSLLSSPVWPPVVRCTSWLDFTLQEPLSASKHPFLCFLCQNVCKIPTPTIDKTALTRCLKMAKGQWLSQRKSFV